MRRAINPGSRSKRFERCVDKVSRRGGVRSPEAVCAASLRKRGWKPGRRNPQDSYDEDGNRIGPVVKGPAGQELYLYRGRWHLGSGSSEKEVETWEASELAAQWGKRLPKGNPAAEAAALSKAFHGRKARTATEVVEKLRVHSNLTDLGGMEELTIYDPDGRHGHRIRFGHDVRLASNEKGTQLYFVDGDQEIDLSSFPWVDGSKEKAEIGPVYSITYHTTKEHIRGRDGGEGSYEHVFGEEGGDPPVLLYDTRNDLIELAGGTYRVEVDRRTRLSPGIVD